MIGFSSITERMDHVSVYNNEYHDVDSQNRHHKYLIVQAFATLLTGVALLN
jgi:hypothetical protein